MFVSVSVCVCLSACLPACLCVGIIDRGKIDKLFDIPGQSEEISSRGAKNEKKFKQAWRQNRVK